MFQERDGGGDVESYQFIALYLHCTLPRVISVNHLSIRPTTLSHFFLVPPHPLLLILLLILTLSLSLSLSLSSQQNAMLVNLPE